MENVYFFKKRVFLTGLKIILKKKRNKNVYEQATGSFPE